jgi:DNA-binding CsgD family transcriptional regulator
MNRLFSSMPLHATDVLTTILDRFVDGILVLTQQGALCYANKTAEILCQQLQGMPAPDEQPIPAPIWRACAALIDSRDLYPDHRFVMDSEIATAESTVRLQVQWLTVQQAQPPLLLVRLQDQTQSERGLAQTEAQAWNLTERETEIWLLRRIGWSRKEIAAHLYIVEDTVKKHLKNIQMKRKSALDEEDEERSPLPSQGLTTSAGRSPSSTAKPLCLAG